MAANYNLNSSFGLNISPKTAQMTASQKLEAEIKASVNNIFNQVGNYFETNEKVFNGDVEKEINMYSRQMMIVGMNMKASDDTVRRFDMNF